MDKQPKILQFVTKKCKSGISSEKNNISDFIKKKLAMQNEIQNPIQKQNESEIEQKLKREEEKTKKLTNDLKEAVVLLRDAGAVNLQKDIELSKHIDK